MSTRTGLLDGLRAIRFLEAGGQSRPLLVLYYPPSPFNPFQRLLYAEGWSRGIVALAVTDLDDVEAIVEVARGRVDLVLHLHWLQRVTDRSPTGREAVAAGERFLGRLDSLRERGCPVAWTVHNVLPHDARHVDAAILVRRGVVERAALVHALAAGTPAAVAPWFEIPADRLAVIPHPSYAGVYPDTVSRVEARFELGLYPEELVHLAFGTLRAYKDIPGILDAWRGAASTPRVPRRLVVAGHAPPQSGRDELMIALETTPDVISVGARVPVEAVQIYFRAADVAVLAQRDALNSGGLLLALTFGVPVIAPRIASAVEIVDERVARLYDADDPDGLLTALRSAPDLATEEAAAAAREIAARYEPARISRAFVDELRRRISPVG